jgi:hypothetical protein
VDPRRGGLSDLTVLPRVAAGGASQLTPWALTKAGSVVSCYRGSLLFMLSTSMMIGWERVL